MGSRDSQWTEMLDIEIHIIICLSIDVTWWGYIIPWWSYIATWWDYIVTWKSNLDTWENYIVT